MDALTFNAPSRVEITAADWEKMRLDVARKAPEEACGLLAGVIQAGVYTVREVISTTNALHSPVRYRIEPNEQLAAFEQIDAAGLQLVGIYHSHPNGPDRPSQTDLAEAYYPEAAYLIWSRAGDEWRLRAFACPQGAFYALELEVMRPTVT
jgi:proteasome lid subunit RPN8/RPN11